jgi:hypothetical protein
MKFLIFMFFVFLSISLILCESTDYEISKSKYLPDSNQVKVHDFVNKHRKEARDYYSFRALMHTAETMFKIEDEGILVSHKKLFGKNRSYFVPKEHFSTREWFIFNKLKLKN